MLPDHIRRRDMSELLNEIVDILSYNEYTDNQVMTMMNYLIQEGNAKNPMQFITEIAKKSEKHEEALMTMSQALREEGIQKGMQKGMQKGKLEGIQEGIQKGRQEEEKQAYMKIARQLLESGMGRQSVRKLTGLTETEMKSLFQDSP
ncbi:hypothetical protein [Candidatus Williamhamiltonella defendens]|uniref:hypothetical protein n=1 Tax=Candidatus Williamhamiltonella defendens TaxID=138072 RepID=UPI001651BF41|nr:hypothetical protein [Candidatus Hamiltonella defensa]